MDWVPDATLLAEVRGLLRESLTPSSDVQRRLNEGLQTLRARPDGVSYLAYLFAEGAALEAEAVRQVAGLVLKNILTGEHGGSAAAVAFAKARVLAALTDPLAVLRSTAGSVVTAILTKCGCDKWPEALETLNRNVRQAPSIAIATTTLETFSKIAEDELEVIANEISAAASANGAFVVMSNEHFLPMLFSLSSNSGVHLDLKSLALEILQLYNRHHAFAPAEFAQQFFTQFWDVIGRAALDPQPKTKLVVLKAFNTILEYNLNIIFDNAHIIYEFFVICSGDPDYDVRLAALDFWPEVLKDKKGALLLKNFAARLAPILLEQTRYSDVDLAQVDPAQLEDDNAEVPDCTNLAPRFHQKRLDGEAEDDMDDDDTNRGNSTWGNAWTVRKAAASALDSLAIEYPEIVIPVCLPVIEQKLQNQESWEERESGVLILGAISKGCLMKLDPNVVPGVLSLLIQLSADKKPLLRSICCWTLGRYSPWYCKEDRAPMYLEKVILALLVRMVDRNKCVQETACTAMAVVEENALYLITPYLPMIYECYARCLREYQSRNQAVLADAISTLASSVGASLTEAHPSKVTQILFVALLEKWNKLQPEDYETAAFCECVSTLFGTLRGVMSPMANMIIVKCVAILEHHLLNLKAEQGQRSDEVMEYCMDAISVVCYTTPGLPIVGETKLIELIVTCICDVELMPYHNLQQSTIAIIGDLVTSSYLPLFVPVLPQILPAITNNLHHSLWAVASNASWCLGQIVTAAKQESAVGAAVKEALQPHLYNIDRNLIKIIKLDYGNLAMRQNACVTLGLFAATFPEVLAQLLSEDLVIVWCQLMTPYVPVAEKITSYLGLLKTVVNVDAGQELMRKKPELFVHCAQSITSVAKPSPELEELKAFFAHVFFAGHEF